MASDFEKVGEQTLFNGEKIQEYKLPNGLQVLILPRHQAKVMTYQTWFRVGSLDEKQDPKLKKTGLAHLFEHMMFRGSLKYPDGKFDELTARLGGDRQNATTSFHRTNYYESVPSHQIEKMMELESDRMKNLNLTSEIFEKEKGAVVGELRRHLDSPRAISYDEVLKLAYPKSAFRYTVLGTEEEIKGFALEEAQYFYKTYYAPNNATLIFVGDVEVPQLMKWVSRYYGDMKKQEVPRIPVPAEDPQKQERTIETTHPQATSESMLMAYHIPDVKSADYPALALLATHLSTGMEGRFRKLLVDTGIAVGSLAYAGNSPDLFMVSVQMAEKRKVEEALKIIDKEITAVQKAKIPAASFQRALNQELLHLYSQITDNSELGDILGEYLCLSGSYMRGFEVIEQFKKLTPADLQRVAKTYLQKTNRSVVKMRPAAETKGKGKKGSKK